MFVQGGAVLFFKKDEDIDMTSVNIAFYSVFIYWAGFLLLNSILELYDKGFEVNSLILLLTGLAVFYVSEFAAIWIRKWIRHRG